jgi:hypothetical protein
VEEGAVGTSADLIDDIGLEIAVDGTGNVAALACGEREERMLGYQVEGVGRRSQGGGKSTTQEEIDNSHTSLGEESAETVVGVGLLALIGEVSIGLSSVLDAVTRLPLSKRGRGRPS